MKISICITTYNSERYIDETLNSVVRQTKKPYEIIVSDNASHDKTINIVSKYSSITCHVNPENIGVNENHNKCIDLASGDYLILLSSDDCFAHSKVIEQLERVIHDNCPECIALGVVGQDKNDTLKYSVYSGRDAVYLSFIGELPFRQIFSMMAFKKDILDKLRVKSNNEFGYGDDTKFYHEIMMKSKKYINIETPMILYRVNQTSVTNSIDVNKRFKMHGQILRKWVYKDFYDILGWYGGNWVMAGEFLRVENEMPDSQDKVLLLKSGFTVTEKIVAHLRTFATTYMSHKLKVILKNIISHNKKGSI